MDAFSFKSNHLTENYLFLEFRNMTRDIKGNCLLCLGENPVCSRTLRKKHIRCLAVPVTTSDQTWSACGLMDVSLADYP